MVRAIPAGEEANEHSLGEKYKMSYSLDGIPTCLLKIRFMVLFIEKVSLVSGIKALLAK